MIFEAIDRCWTQHQGHADGASDCTKSSGLLMGIRNQGQESVKGGNSPPPPPDNWIDDSLIVDSDISTSVGQADSFKPPLSPWEEA